MGVCVFNKQKAVVAAHPYRRKKTSIMPPATHRIATQDGSSNRHVLIHKQKNENDDDEQMNLLILLTLEGACGRWRRSSKDRNNNNDRWCPETCLSDKDLHCQHQWIRQWQRLLWSQENAINWNNLRNARYPHWNVYHLLFSSARPQRPCCSNLRVLNALYKAWPDGLSHPDAIFGRLPLHLAVQAQAPWKILQRMIALCPLSVMHSDSCGYRPIHGLLLLLSSNNRNQGTSPQPPMWYIQDVARLLYKAQIQWQSGLVLAGPLDQKLLESNILGPILVEVLHTHSRRMTNLCLQDMTIDSSMLHPKRLLSCCRRLQHLEFRNVRGSGGFVDQVLSSLSLRQRPLERLILVDCDLHGIDVLENFLFQTCTSKRRCHLGQSKNTNANPFLVDLSDNPLENVSPNQWERVLSKFNKHSVLFAGTSLPPSVLQACSIDYIVAAMNYYSNRPQVLYFLLQHRMDLLFEVKK